ncbi:MAG: c-type cytochrome [Planctomycetes bacterium]|nr:c-type cytochrome [Planctomycetota bacterium]
MLNRVALCAVALALCLGATCLSIMAQDEKPAEKPDAEPTKEAVKRSEVPEKFKEMEAPDLKDADRIAAGKKAYASSCAGCHGEAGKGDGKYAAKMDPKPTDLTTAEFQDAVTDQYILWRIKTGDEGYAGEGKSKMKSKGSASDAELWELTAFVRSLKPAKVEILSHDEMEGVMDDFKAEWKSVQAATTAKDKDKGVAAADKIAELSDKLMGYDGNVRGGDHDGEKVRDQADWKKFVEDFKNAAAEYSKLAKDGKWDKAGEEQQKIGDGCGNCHDVYKKKRR